MAGQIDKIYVKLGDTVTQHAPLIKIGNMDLERNLRLARIQLKESNLTIAYYQKLLHNEQESLKISQKIAQNRIISAQTLLKITEQEVTSAQQNLERYTVLYKKHYISKALIENKIAKLVKLQEKLKNAHANYQAEEQSLKAMQQGMYFISPKTEGKEQDLSAELEVAIKKSELNQSKIKIYENLIKKLTLKAPFDGKIIQILKSEGNISDTIKPIIFIEKTNTNKHITAYLTQKEIVHVGGSKWVSIYIPSSGKTYRGKILEIDRTDGFVDMVKAQYRWRDFQLDRSAMVTIAIRNKDQADFDKTVFPGMPAVVYFSKKMTL